jgi:hypothetical protein
VGRDSGSGGPALWCRVGLSGFGDPGLALEYAGERVDFADTGAGGGGEVGTAGAEFFGAAVERAQPEALIRSLLILVARSAELLGRYAQVTGVPQGVRLAVFHPRGGVPFLLELAVTAGVEGKPGRGGLATGLGARPVS